MKDPRFAETVIYMVNMTRRGLRLVIIVPMAKGALKTFFKGFGTEINGRLRAGRHPFMAPGQHATGLRAHSDEHHNRSSMRWQTE